MANSRATIDVEELLFKSTANILKAFDHVQAPDRYSGDAETDLPDIQSIDDAVRNIIGGIERLLQDTIYLKRCRNSLNAFGSLPAEILLEIFRWCPQKKKKIKDQCFAFSQVCHRWREVAISDATLWTTPDLFRPNLAEDIFKNRSAQLPLHIHCPDLWNGWQVIKLPSHLRHRVESIDVWFERDIEYESEHDLHEFLDSIEGFAILKTISLKCHGKDSRALIPLGFKAPSLRSVTLENCLPHWKTDFISNLTSLTIVLENSLAFSNIQSFSILTVLRRNPNLKKLKLQDVMCRGRQSSLTSPTPNDTEPLEFAQLEKLTLLDDVHMVAPLLRLLKVPVARDVEISADLIVSGDWTVHMQEYGAALHQFVALNEWTTEFGELEILIGPNMRVRFGAGGGPCDDFVLKLCRTETNEERRAWISILADKLPWANLKDVWIQRLIAAQGVSIAPFCAALSKAPTLDFLDLLDEMLKPQMLEDVLAELEPRDPDAPNIAQTFPALKTLRVHKMNMYKETLESQRISVFQKLVSVMDRRKEAGENVPKTKLKKCSFLEDHEGIAATSAKGMNVQHPHIVPKKQPDIVESGTQKDGSQADDSQTDSKSE